MGANSFFLDNNLLTSLPPLGSSSSRITEMYELIAIITI